jgi:hypothetical protein
VDPRASLEDVEKRKFLTLPGLKLRPLGRPARSKSLYRLRCPSSSGRCGEGKSFFLLLQIEIQFLDSPAHSLDTIWTELHQLPFALHGTADFRQVARTQSPMKLLQNRLMER